MESRPEGWTRIRSPGRTLPLAIYAALQQPGGEATAARLSLVALGLAMVGLLVSDRLGRRIGARLR